MFGLPIPDPLLYLGLGWLMKDQLKQGAQGPQPAPVALAPYGPPPYAPPPGVHAPAWTPGAMAHAAPPRPAVARKPMGPVALDNEIPEETEASVWKCLGETDEPKARSFGQALAEAGYPIAAAVVNMHVHAIVQFRKIQEAQAKAAQAAGAPEPMRNGNARPEAPKPALADDVKDAG